MPQFRLSWREKIDPFRYGGMVNDPSWSDVQDRLHAILSFGGSVVLHIVDPPSLGPQQLEVIADSGRFFLGLAELTEDDHEVRIFYDGNAKGNLVAVFGDYLDDRTLCGDRQLVYQCFEEFFQTGDVTRELLDL